MEFCEAWEEERETLRKAVGADLSLQSIIREMLQTEEKWTAMSTFCEEVLTRKEVAEREREEDHRADPLSAKKRE